MSKSLKGTKVGLVAAIVSTASLRAVLIGGTVLFSVMTARLYGAAVLGLVGIAQLCARVLGEWLGSGVPMSAIADSQGRRASEVRWSASVQQSRLVRRAAKGCLLIAAAAGALAALTGIPPLQTIPFGLSIALLAPGVLSLRLNWGFATAQGRPLLAVTSDFGLVSIAAAALLLLLPRVADDSLQAALVVVTFGLAVHLFALIQRHFVEGPKAEREVPRSGWKVRKMEGRIIAFNTALVPLGNLVGPGYLAVVGRAEEAGSFIGALRIGIIGPVVLSIVVPVFAIRIADVVYGNRRRALCESILVASTLYLPFLGAILLMGDRIVLIFGDGLPDAGAVLLIVVVAQLPGIVGGLSASLLNLAGLARMETVAQMSGIVCIVLMLSLLTQTALSAGIALLAGTVVRALVGFCGAIYATRITPSAHGITVA